MREIEHPAFSAKLPEKRPRDDTRQKKHDAIRLAQFLDRVGRRQGQDGHPRCAGRANAGLRIFNDQTLIGRQERPLGVVQPLQGQEIDGGIRLPDRRVLRRDDPFNGPFDLGPAQRPIDLLAPAAGSDRHATERPGGVHKLDHTGKELRLLCSGMKPE